MIGVMSIFGLWQSTSIVESHEDNIIQVAPVSEQLSVSYAAVKKESFAGLSKQLQDAEALLAEADAALALETVFEEVESMAVESFQAWSFPQESYLTPDVPINDAVISKTVVKMDHTSVDYPEPGAKVTMPLLNGETVTATVKQASVAANGDYSWSGHLEGHGTDYPITMTYGEQSAFSMITTPQGSYTMETVNGLGWVYKNPSELELSEPGMPHALEYQQPL